MTTVALPIEDRVPCPAFGAAAERRVASGGFGLAVRDVCGVCGHEFDEYTTRDEEQP